MVICKQSALTRKSHNMGFYTKNGGLVGTGNITSKTGVYDAIASQLIVPELYNFTTFTFTNAGVTGRQGPPLSNCLSAYDTANNSWLNNTEYFNMITQGIQRWTVPKTGLYTITANGARGGTGNSYQGAGASCTGTFALTRGDILQILVGQSGLTGTAGCGGSAGGGGGGSFVVTNGTGVPLIIAGGGGGGSAHGTLDTSRCDANPNSTNGNPGQNATGNGGVGPAGGTYATTGCVNGAGGGGGFSFDGGDLSSGTNGGKAFMNGGLGGLGYANYGGLPAEGGFGGGAGASTYMGGGGGGYGGGGGGAVSSDCSCSTIGGGGGGGSYNSGTNQTNGFHSNINGSVIIIAV
jgi:hypothetical protein